MKILLSLCLLILLLNSCATLKNNAKYELANGVYQLKSGNSNRSCYLENTGDSIVVYEIPSKNSISLPSNAAVSPPIEQRIVKHSLDIDILTALFKVRPKVDNILPTQLTTNLNGNIYVGHRSDIYQIRYRKNPLDIYQRQITHFGFSGGLFLGLGSTALNPSTTNNGISTEYEGIVLQKGIGGTVAVNKLTIGLSIGFDNLLDKNDKTWIYENKPWLGLMLGLNLN